MTRSRGERSTVIHDGLATSAQQLERTAWISADVPQLRDAASLLLRAQLGTEKRFISLRARLLDAARMIALDAAVLREASTLSVQFDLEFPDAVMLASVLADASAQRLPSIFLNRNTKDFDDPDIRARLKQVNCDAIWKFGDGLSRVQSVLAKQPGQIP